MISREKSQKKKKLKTFVLLENNQPATQCLVKKKKKHWQSYLTWYVKVLNALNRAKLEYQISQN